MPGSGKILARTAALGITVTLHAVAVRIGTLATTIVIAIAIGSVVALGAAVEAPAVPLVEPTGSTLASTRHESFFEVEQDRVHLAFVSAMWPSGLLIHMSN